MLFSMKNKQFLNFNVIITQDEDKTYVANCPAIPGCHSQGATYEKAEKNIKEAIQLCLEVAQEDEEYKTCIEFESAISPRMVSVSTISIQYPQFA